jgi:tetratricopeptide (TPR) repeat protein
MQVRRNYSEPFFREKRRGPARLRALLLVLLVIGAALGVLWLQRDAIVYTVADLSGTLPTPTPFASDLARQADGRYWQGDLAGAAELYAAVIAQRPEHIDYLYEYGQVLVDLERASEAFELADRIVVLDPANPKGYALRANALVWMGQPAQAIPVALAGLEFAPEYEPLYTALSRASTNDSRWQDGLDFGQEAVALNPNSVRAHWAYAWALTSVGAFDEAISELSTAIDLHPLFLPPFFEKASLLLAQDRDREAIAMYEQILAIDSRNARALLRQCDAYRKVGEFQRAVGFCEDAITADPGYAAAQFRLGMLRYNDRQFGAARDAFAACHASDPASLECFYRLGLANYYLGECEEARSVLEQAAIMVRGRDDAQDAAADIEAGLAAIASDPACRVITPPGRSAETTPEPGPLAASD